MQPNKLSFVLLAVFFVAALATYGCMSAAKAIETSQQTVQQSVQQAQQLIGQGKFVEAETLLEQVTQQNPNAARAWYLLGYARHAQKKYDKALEAHLKAAEFPQTRANALYNAACVYSIQAKVDQCIETLKLAIAAGYGDRGQLESDPDFENARKDPRFSKLLPPILKGSDAFVEPVRILLEIEGEGPNSEFGWVARKVGDLDNDGVIDFATTAPGYNNHAGKLYAYSSKTGKVLFTQVGTPGQRFGNGVCGIGDVNSDGTPDVLAGGPLLRSGAAYVLSGKDGSFIYKLEGENEGDQFGYKLFGLGDVNSDGHTDFIVTALNANKAYAYSGKDASLLFTVQGEGPTDKFGSAVSADPASHTLVIGAQDAGNDKRGRVYCYRYDAKGAKLAFTFDSRENCAELGQMFLSFPGDLDKDGQADVFAVDFNASNNLGEVFVFSGKDGKVIHDIKGSHPGEMLGTSVSDAGDVDGDRVGDLVVGAWQNAQAAASGGKVYLISGATGKTITAWTCKQGGDTFGFDAQGIGDVDGDGKIDFLLTSAWSSVKGAKTGRVYIFAGG